MGLFDGTILERPVVCERCLKDIKVCDCPAVIEPDVAPEKQKLRIQIEKRKNGKQVTVIRGFACRSDTLKTLLADLKNACGAGGSVDETSSIEIQGKHVATIKKKLTERGYRAVEG
jgi:translation initiation factor 1